MGPKDAVQFPFLADGELIGVLQFATEGHDYRDQPIAKGVYTMRYGLQPVNGDHLGVSTYRDYSLVLPAAKDQSLALPRRKQLEERSAESAGTSHPAVFLLLAAPPDSSKSAASVIHDAEKNTWSVVLPLSLADQGPERELLALSSTPRGDWSSRGVTRGRVTNDSRARIGLEYRRSACRGSRVEDLRYSWRDVLPAQNNDDARFLADCALACLWDRTGAARSSPVGRYRARAGDMRRGHAGRGAGFRTRVLGFVSGLPFRLLPARGSAGVTPWASGFSRSFRSLFTAGSFTGSAGPRWCARTGGWVD